MQFFLHASTLSKPSIYIYIYILAAALPAHPHLSQIIMEIVCKSGAVVACVWITINTFKTQDYTH